MFRDLAGIKDWKKLSTTSLSGLKQSKLALHPHEDKEKEWMVCMRVYDCC